MDNTLLQFGMEETPNKEEKNEILNFDMPLHKSSYIKVIGVGGGGSNAVNHMYRQGIKGVDFIVCNTDAQALDASPVPTKVQLGKGLGAGNVPGVAENAARSRAEEIKELLGHNTQMLFITAGMGGGTGTGAAPVIAQIAKEINLADDEVDKILTVGIVTTPFSFEGRKRLQQAKDGIEELKKHVDAILIINNDKLRDFGNLGITKAFAKADDILTTAAKGISEIMTVSSYVQIDFKDVNTVMKQSGVALMGTGVGEGENRAEEAIFQAINSPLLNDNNIKGAKNVLLYIASGNTEVTMDEIDIITKIITDQTGGKEADVIWGYGENAELGDAISITLVATGFQPNALFHEMPKPSRVELEKTVERERPVIPTTTVINANPAAPVIDLDGEIYQPSMQASIEKKEEEKSAGNNPLQMFEALSQNIMELEITEKEEITITSSLKRETVVEDEISVRSIQKTTVETSEIPPVAGGYDVHTKNRLKQLSAFMSVGDKIRTQEGLEEIENIPAYKRRQMELKEPVHSSESEVSRTMITAEGRITSNPFLHDNVD